jgi:tetratricopeptide (TPR) repeat protein
VGLLAAIALAAGCGGGGTAREMRRAFEKGDYAEVVTLGRHAQRTGEDAARVHYYYGLALVALDRDHEGFPEIDRAVGAEPGLKADAAAFLREAGARGGLARTDASRRWAKAWELDPEVDVGRERFAIADHFFRERRFESAAALYEEAVHAYPDTSACETAYARLAECWTELGEPEKAKRAMETLVERYPRGRYAGGVASNLDDLSLVDARRHFEAGEYEETIEVARELVARTDNRLLQQKGRYLLGETYEAMGDRVAAYNEYREIIRADRGDSGRLVEQARERIEALQEAGLK